MHNRSGIILFQLIIAAVGIGMLAVATANAGTPAAVVQTDSYDFGTVFEGSDVIHDYMIKNTGDADLEIQKVKTG